MQRTEGQPSAVVFLCWWKAVVDAGGRGGGEGYRGLQIPLCVVPVGGRGSGVGGERGVSIFFFCLVYRGGLGLRLAFVGGLHV